MEKRFRNKLAIVIGIFFVYSILTMPKPVDQLGRFYYICWSIVAILFGLYWGINNRRFADSTSKLYAKMYAKTKLPLFKGGAEYYGDKDVFSFVRIMSFMFAIIGFTLLCKVLFLN